MMKKSNSKKYLALFLATLLILTSLSVGVATAETEGFFQFEIVNEYDADFENGIADTYAVITKYNGSESTVSVPSTIGGYPVKVVEYAAFMGNSAVTSVTIPDSVVSIGDNAFENCVNLTQLNLPDTLKSIGYGILTGTPICENGENWDEDLLYIGKYLLDFDDSSEAADITVKEGTELIASMIFSFSDVECVNLPESLKFIGDMAFSYCENIKSIVLPNNLESIGFWAFENCTGITEIKIPSSVKSIGEGAFTYCENLKNVTLPDDLEEIPMSLFEGCASLKNINIPSTVCFIEDYAFYESGLETVTIPKGVDYVGSSAFARCENLSEINMESGNPLYYSVDGVLYEDFGYGIYITTYPAGKAGESFTVPSDVRNLSLDAFNGVKNLKTVVLNDFISDVKLYYADSLEKIEVPETSQYLYDVDGVVFDLLGKLLYYPAGKKDAEYTVPNKAYSIDECAFLCNPYIEKLTIGEDREFTLNFYSILDCKNLKVINLPSKLKMKDSIIIGGCDSLHIINFNGTKSQWDAFKCEPYSNSPEGLYLNCTDGTFELIAPYEEETDFTDNTEPAKPTEPGESVPDTTVNTEPAEPTATTPNESTTTEPTENKPSEDTTKPEAEFELGDVNMDKKLNIRDATAIQKHLAKISTLSEDAVSLADYTKDGKVNIKDATTIQKKIAGLI